MGPSHPFSSAKAALLKVTTTNCDLCSEPIFCHVQIVRFIFSAIQICQILNRSQQIQVSLILGTEQKERGIWERECFRLKYEIPLIIGYTKMAKRSVWITRSFIQCTCIIYRDYVNSGFVGTKWTVHNIGASITEVTVFRG